MDDSQILRIVQEHITIVNTIMIVLMSLKHVYVGQLLQYLCNRATNSPQYTRKDIVF